MLTVKLSSKRHATFPRSVCESLGLKPGDEIVLEPTITDGEESWALRPTKARQRPWLHRLNRYAKGEDHSMESIRASIATGRQK
jgi:bifunctional DNA-binding transcriptional regulator/antitoxin component of YhaV-PrlF toxin-antitoxin module